MSKSLEKLPNTIWILAAGLLCVGAGQSIVFITIPPIARDLGLNEIQIPISWNNVGENDVWFRLSPQNLNVKWTPDLDISSYTTLQTVKAGYFKSTEILLHYLNNLVPKFGVNNLEHI